MSAAACPRMIALNGTPSSPTSLRNRVQDRRPSSPTIKIRGQMTLPSIATICSSPSSPTKFAVFKCPVSPTPQMKTAQVTSTAVSDLSTSATAATFSNLSISSNKREQPLAGASPVAVTGGKRKLGKGCGLLDWIRLCRTKKGELGGPGGEKRPVTLAELAQHNTEDDAWTAIRGKVYNITHYVRFHPGGKEDLMKGAGIDCSIIFDEVHSWVNVESTLKACLVGPLVANSPNTQRRNSSIIMLNAARLRRESATLTVPKPKMITDGVNKQAVPLAMRKASVDTLLTEAITTNRKNSLDLRMDDNTAVRKNSMAAIACEEPDGLRQVSPESPIRPTISETPSKKVSTASLEAAEGSSMRLSLPPSRIRRNSEPHPRFHWVQSEKAMIIHITTNNLALKTSDVILDINGTGRTFEATLFINDWVFELNIALLHAVVSSQVVINCGRVEISLKKEVPHQQWEDIGKSLEGHCRLTHKSKRESKYRSTVVDSIKRLTHDTMLYTLRLPAGSYMTIPTGHHLSIKAQVNGLEVVRSYTPVSALEANRQRSSPLSSEEGEGETIELMIKLYHDGKMSSFLSNLKEGDKVVVSDPEGSFDASSRLTPASDILLLAAGSGFTPMVKILHDFMSTELVSASRQRNMSASEASGEAGEDDQQAPLRPPLVNKVETVSPKTAKMLFANKKEMDMMYREELEHLHEATAGRFSVAHILSNAEKSWDGLRGRISKTLLSSHLPAVNGKKESALVCVCGPEPFTQGIVNMLVDLDFPYECIQVFQ